MSRFYTDKMGIVYYNATITNETSIKYNSIPAEFSQSFDNALLTNTKDYDLCITRFCTSSQSIPFWVVPIQLNQPDPKLTVYGIKTYYTSPSNNTFVCPTVYLMWDNKIAAPQNNGEPIIQQNLNNGYYFSYTRADFINMFNKAMDTALNLTRQGFNAAYPADPNPAPNIGSQFLSDGRPNPYFPVLSWSEGLNKFQMYFPLSFFQSSINSYFGYGLSLNNLIYPFLQFPSTNNTYDRVNDSSYFQVEITQNDNYYKPSFYTAFPDLMALNYIIVYSDHDTTGIFSPLHRIVITSNTLPTSSEIVQPASYPFQIVNPSQNINIVNTKIITDFQPDLYSTNQINRDFIQFNQSVNNSRLISLQNYAEQLTQLDIKIFWTDFNNNVYPLVLYAGCSFDIKMAFVPRIYITSSN